MADLSHWVYANDFTGRQAAFLILGVDPASDTNGLSCDHVLSRLSRAYLGALHSLRAKYDVEPLPDFLTNSPPEPPVIVSPREELRSVEMEEMCVIWGPADEDSLKRWLAHEPDFVGSQRFSRVALSRWLSENGLPTKYDFRHTPSPRKTQLAEAAALDADDPQYPELLHIAFRAWEHARESNVGTPKQRVMAYLEDRYPQSRHPHIGRAARQAIASVANWDKSGGRPKK